MPAGPHLGSFPVPRTNWRGLIDCDNPSPQINYLRVSVCYMRLRSSKIRTVRKARAITSSQRKSASNCINLPLTCLKSAGRYETRRSQREGVKNNSLSPVFKSFHKPFMFNATAWLPKGNRKFQLLARRAYILVSKLFDGH